VSTAKTIKEHKDSTRAYFKREMKPTPRRLRRQETLKYMEMEKARKEKARKESEKFSKELKAEEEKYLDSIAPEERRRSKPIRKLREHIKTHRGKSANVSAEKPSSNKKEGYKGEACGKYRNAPCI
jgi:hypothetical protein